MTDKEYNKILKQYHKLSDRHILVVETDMPYSDVLKVVSTPRSFEFCFDGVKIGSSVAIGMIGCKNNHLNFMRGYTAMLDKLQPSQIIVFGTPFPEMEGNIIPIDYRTSRKVVR